MKKNKSVFQDLGFNDRDTMALTIKADLYSKILDIVEKQKIKPRELEKLLDIPQPRVSELLNGKMSSMSIEKLLGYLESLGVEASLAYKQHKAG